MKGRTVVICPKCGGRLVYDELYQVSHIYQINLDGTISTRFKRGDEGPEEFAYVRCERCDFIVGPDEYDYANGRIKLRLNREA